MSHEECSIVATEQFSTSVNQENEGGKCQSNVGIFGKCVL